MKHKKTFRLTMLGVLCAGLLLIGVGAGVAFAEFSDFTYGGQRTLNQAAEQSQTLTVPLSAEGTTYIQAAVGPYDVPLREAGRIETRESVETGTAEISLRSRGVDVKTSYWYEDAEDSRDISVYWKEHGREVALFMAYKDQLLEDLMNRRLSDHIPVELTEMVVYVNPADADRVVLK